MPVSMIIRRKGDYRDARPVPLRREGVPLLKKHGATAHHFGYYHSGPYAGQMFIVLQYPDIAAHEKAMQGMAADPAWKKVAGEVEKIAPLQESFLTVITEEN